MFHEFTAFATDDTSLAVLRQWAERQGYPGNAVVAGGAEQFADLLESESPPRIVMVDLDGQDKPLDLAKRLVGLCGGSTRIVALHTVNDVKLYRDMIAAGLADFLVKPLTAESLSQSLELINRSAEPTKPENREAKIITIIGTRGGTGVSTLAVNLGWLMAHEYNKSCILVDLDLQFGTSALALDLEPGRGLRDILSSPERVDRLMIDSAISRESDRFTILSAEETVDDTILVDSTALTTLMREMTPHYDYILVDLPRNMLATQKRLLAVANEVILVTEMTLAGIRDTLRIRAALRALGTGARITQVASRIGPQHPAAVDEATFAKGAQAKIDFTIPDDPKSINAASNAGKPLGAIAAGSPIVKSLQGLAIHFVGTQKTPAVKKSGLFGMGGKTDSAKDHKK